MTLREQKQAIRDFLRTDIWTTEKLCALLAHAQDKLSMWSCCCLIGVSTADHALRGEILRPVNPSPVLGLSVLWDVDDANFGDHYWVIDIEVNTTANAAETAFFLIGDPAEAPGELAYKKIGYEYRWDRPASDDLRRRRLRPIIRAELRRREQGRLSREAAVLALSVGWKMQRPDEDTLDALSGVACPTADFAGLVLTGE